MTTADKIAADLRDVFRGLLADNADAHVITRAAIRADPDRAAQCRDDAAQCRAGASALAALLQAAGAQVLIPAEGQLSLFGDGQ